MKKKALSLALAALMLVVFAISYVSFMRQEIRSR